MVARFLLVVLLAVFAGRVQAQVTAAEAVAAAEAAYNAGDYAAAIEQYERLIENGITSAQIYYNLGSAYYESDDLGRALVNTLRAQRLAPRDNDINLNLVLIRALRVDVQGDDTAPLDVVAAFTAEVMTTAELGWLVFVLWTVWFMLLIVWITRSRLRLPLLVLGGVLVFALLVFAGRLIVEAQRPAAVVTAFTVTTYTGPGEDYPPLFTLHSAAELRVLERRGEWARFSLPNGRQGWVALESIEQV